MRLKQYYVDTTTTGTVSPWHMLDWRQNPFSVSFQVDAVGGAAFIIELGYSDLVSKKVTVTRSTTTATLTYANHGLTTGDSVIVYNCGAPLDGTFTVTRSSSNVVTYTVANSGATAVYPDLARAIFIKPMTHSSFSSPATASIDCQAGAPVQFVRLKVTTGAAGNATLLISQGSNY